MITDMKGTAKSEAKVAGERADAALKEREAKIDPTAPVEPIQRQRATELVQAVAVDAARLALNLGVLSERLLIEDDANVFLARAVKQQQQLLEECLRRNEDLDEQLQYAKRHHGDVVRGYEGRISAGMHENERLKGRVDEESARADIAQAEASRAATGERALRMSVADRLLMPQDSEWSQLLPLIGKR